MTLTSFFGDLGYEMIIAVLPGFFTALGIAAAALGWIEGAADALASFIKLGSGWYSDRMGRRKPIVTLGYFLSGTAMSAFALATSWPLVLGARLVAWFGKGIRGPLRDAMLSDSATPETRGRVFGLHRAGDTMGAILGPLAGVWLLGRLPRPDPAAPFRQIFLISLIPGLLAVASMVVLVREMARPGSRGLKLWAAVRDLPRPYLRFLTGVGLFGLGDSSPTLLILAATQLLSPQMGVVRAGQVAGLLYVLRNALYALIAYPAGALGDRMPKRTLLAAGYAMGAITAFGTVLVFASGTRSIAILAAIFALSGIYIGVHDALEGAIPPDLVPGEVRGTAYGLMGAVNGVGDLAASGLVGTLWTVVSPEWAFGAAGVLMAAGALLMARLPAHR